MTQKQVQCPACRRWFAERGLRLHFRQALSGWDPRWDSRQPHTRWARSKGINVADGGYLFNFDELYIELDKYLNSQ